VQTQTERLIHLVDDLLVVSRVEGGALVLEPEDVQIRPLLAQVVAGLGGQMVASSSKRWRAHRRC
jgi:signal transduction histidine kinase